MKHWDRCAVDLIHANQPHDDQQEISNQEYSKSSLLQNQTTTPNNTDPFVFASFNRQEKIEQTAFNAWMECLNAINDSVILLYVSSAPDDLAAIKNSLRQRADEAGVDPARLYFAEKIPNSEHLARHAVVDVFLDTRYIHRKTEAASIRLRLIV